jgi:hypothetical protein
LDFKDQQKSKWFHQTSNETRWNEGIYKKMNDNLEQFKTEKRMI